MGHADLRVGNKIFASLPPDGRTVALRVTPTDLDFLVTSEPKTFQSVWGGRWLGVNLDRVTRPILKQLLASSWGMTAPKKAVARFRDER